MAKGKKLLITLPDDLYNKAREKSKEVLGRENVSGMINLLLTKFIKDGQL